MNFLRPYSSPSICTLYIICIKSKLCILIIISLWPLTTIFRSSSPSASGRLSTADLTTDPSKPPVNSAPLRVGLDHGDDRVRMRQFWARRSVLKGINAPSAFILFSFSCDELIYFWFQPINKMIWFLQYVRSFLWIFPACIGVVLSFSVFVHFRFICISAIWWLKLAEFIQRRARLNNSMSYYNQWSKSADIFCDIYLQIQIVIIFTFVICSNTGWLLIPLVYRSIKLFSWTDAIKILTWCIFWSFTKLAVRILLKLGYKY